MSGSAIFRPNDPSLLVNSFTGSEATMPLWVVPALGGSPRRFVEPSGNEGAWMPNGNRLLARVNELFEIDRNGEQKKLASLPSDVYIYWLRWSPDHQTLRFIANDQTGTFVGGASTSTRAGDARGSRAGAKAA
jgi:hypothetical protein